MKNSSESTKEVINMMTYEERKAQVKSYLGKTIKIRIDRPIGYVHKKENYTLIYPINYGYIPGVIGGDGEELDVYLLGVNEPVEEYTAFIIGIVHRENDVEDKLVAVPDAFSLITKEEIEKAISFQEQYYDSHIELLDVEIHNCTAQNCKINGLPQVFLDEYEGHDIISLYLGNDRFLLRTWNDFSTWIKKLEKVVDDDKIRLIYANTEHLRGERGIFLALYHTMKREHPKMSPDANFHLQIAIYQNKMEIKVVEIEE